MQTDDRGEHAREMRLCRMARRMGLRLAKNRSRRPDSATYGGFLIADADKVSIVGDAPLAYSLSLDDVESFLAEAR